MVSLPLVDGESASIDWSCSSLTQLVRLFYLTFAMRVGYSFLGFKRLIRYQGGSAVPSDEADRDEHERVECRSWSSRTNLDDNRSEYFICSLVIDER